MKPYAFVLTGLVWANGAAAQDPTPPCLAQLRDDSRVQSLLEKLPFDVTKGQPLEVLANKTKPTAQEKTALSYFAAEGERCLDLGDEWREKNYPAAAMALLRTYRVELLSALAELYAGNMTFGDVAKFRAKQTSDLKNSLETVVREVQAQREAAEKQRDAAASQESRLNEQREAIAQQQRFAQQQAAQQQEEARRQAALQFLMNRPAYQPNQLQPYQMPPLPRSQTTNCVVNGNQVNCNSR